MKAIEAERLHQSDLIAGHGAERIVRLVGRAFRLGRVAVAAQVGADDGEIGREDRRHPRPHGEALREALQKQKRRALARRHVVNLDVV